MRIDTLEQLAAILDNMKPGDRVSLAGSFHTLWPSPDLPRDDDYLSDRERAERWCRGFACVIREDLARNPPCLVIERRLTTRDRVHVAHAIAGEDLKSGDVVSIGRDGKVRLVAGSRTALATHR